MLSIWTCLKICRFVRLQTTNLNLMNLKISEKVENTVRKDALYEQFLLFPWSFQKTYTADM